MNFKNLYKQTNDNIHGDRKLIDAIYEKADSKIHFNIHAVSLCVASFLVVISLSVLPKFYGGEVINNTSNTEQERKITYKDNENNINDFTNKSVNESEKKSGENEIIKSTPGVSATNNDNKLKSEKSNMQEEVALYDQHNKNINPELQTKDNSSYSDNEITTDNISKQEVIIPYDENSTAAETDESTAENAYIKQRSSERDTPLAHSGSAGGGSGGGSTASEFSFSTDDETVNEYMSVSAYQNYLGIDLNAIFSQLPQDMEMNIPESISLTKNIKSGKYQDDSYTFVALDEAIPSRFLGITTTKLDAQFKGEFDSNEKTTINGCEIAVIRNDDSNSACFQYKGVWISIISFDVSNEDFDSFIKNITK